MALKEIFGMKVNELDEGYKFKDVTDFLTSNGHHDDNYKYSVKINESSLDNNDVAIISNDFLSEVDLESNTESYQVLARTAPEFIRNDEQESDELVQQIISVVKLKYDELLVTNYSKSSQVAAFVIMNCGHGPRTFHVVSLASGSRCNRIRKFDGTRIYDCRAVTLARRSLLLYFYQQIKLLTNPMTASLSIFTFSNVGRFVIRDFYKLCLFMSFVPYGETMASEHAEENSTSFRIYWSENIMRTPLLMVIYKMCNYCMLDYKF